MVALPLNTLWLAPMAGITDAVYRYICTSHGAKLTFTEMISAMAIYQNQVKSEAMLEQLPMDNQPIGAQIFGSDATIMATAAQRIEQKMKGNLACLDLNMGCPVRKVVRRGEGAALLTDIERAKAIVHAVVTVVSVPVTVKIRRGFKETENADQDLLSFAKGMQDNGATAICVHGRYASELYRGVANRAVIKQLVAALSIPIIGSGDVYSQADVAEYMSLGCSAVMAARGAIGNPWIFEGKNRGDITRTEIDQVVLQHIDLVETYRPHDLPVLRAYLGWYYKGMPHVTDLRRGLNNARTADDFRKLIRS